MGIYSERIFPRFFDLVVRHQMFDAHRELALRAVQGKALEIGIGTGINLQFYPPHVKEIAAIDPNPGMERQLLAKRSNQRIKVDFSLAGAEKLPYDDQSFDTVISTLTFCSIPQLPQALDEIKRVMKKGAKLIFLEHGLSADAGVARWQRRLNPIQNVVGCGCSLTVNPVEYLDAAALQIRNLQNYYIARAPKILGFVYEGIAFR